MSTISFPEESVPSPLDWAFWYGFPTGPGLQARGTVGCCLSTMLTRGVWTASALSCPQELWSLFKQRCFGEAVVGMWWRLAYSVSSEFRSSAGLGSSSFRFEVEKDTSVFTSR